MDLGSKSLCIRLIKYITSGPVLPAVLEGKMAVSIDRAMLGQTNPLTTAPGSVRLVSCRNVCHASDSIESAEREIQLWFPEGAADYTLANAEWAYE
jgi:nucleoside-diphosphate kinase